MRLWGRHLLLPLFTSRNLSKELFDALPTDIMFWRSLYNKHDISSCVARVRSTSYKEIIVSCPSFFSHDLESYRRYSTDPHKRRIFPRLYELDNTDSVWEGWLYCHLPNSNVQISCVSGSSLHPQHMMPMDTDAPNNSDVLIFTDLLESSLMPMPSPESQIDSLCNTIGKPSLTPLKIQVWP